MVTFSRTSQATRAGKRTGIVVEGADVIVQQFTRDAATAAARAGAVVVAHVEKAADRMRSTVPVDQGDLLDSITADRRPTVEGATIYADAGPDLDENEGAFKGHLIERGTVNMAPRPFVGPAADAALAEFERAMKALLR